MKETKDEKGKQYNGNGYWVGWVIVSRDFPDIRYSRIFDDRKEAAKNIKLNGTMIIKVKIYPNDQPK